MAQEAPVQNPTAPSQPAPVHPIAELGEVAGCSGRSTAQPTHMGEVRPACVENVAAVQRLPNTRWLPTTQINIQLVNVKTHPNRLRLKDLMGTSCFRLNPHHFGEKHCCTNPHNKTKTKW